MTNNAPWSFTHKMTQLTEKNNFETEKLHTRIDHELFTSDIDISCSFIARKQNSELKLEKNV